MTDCIHGIPLYDCCPDCTPAATEEVPPFLPPPQVREDVANAINRLEAELSRALKAQGEKE